MLRRSGKTSVLMGLILAVSIGASAQQPEVVVGEIDISSLRWGPQKAVFEIQNLADYERMFSVQVKVDFEGIYMSPSRTTRTNYLFGPTETRTLNQDVVIPGNFGKAKLTIGVYDVVDTLDRIFDYQKVFEQPYSLTYHIPEGLESYFQEEITLPPMVSNGFDFDTEFIRLFMLMTSEGKSFQEIADLTKSDLKYVNYVARVMTDKQYYTQTNGAHLTFPVISLAQAEEGRQLAESVADQLATLTETNLPKHRAHLATLAEAGTIPPNADDFMHGGSLLYYTYPTVTGAFYWYDLGSKFIDRTAPLVIYEGTDLCRAQIPRYMYAVQGGAYYNGKEFFHADYGSERMQILFADSIPVVKCIEGFESIAQLFPAVHWSWDEGVAPEPFVFDTALVKVGLKGMREGADALIDKAYNDLKALSVKYGHSEFTIGERLWFWNLVASRAVVKLTQKGVIERRSKGFYSFEQL